MTQAESLRAALELASQWLTDLPYEDAKAANDVIRRALAAAPPAEGLDARLREFLVLRPVGTVGPDKVPWFQHCGISHAEGAECVVCVALAATPPAEGLEPEHDPRFAVTGATAGDELDRGRSPGSVARAQLDDTTPPADTALDAPWSDPVTGDEVERGMADG